jgi:hypothetical protein
VQDSGDVGEATQAPPKRWLGGFLSNVCDATNERTGFETCRVVQAARRNVQQLDPDLNRGWRFADFAFLAELFVDAGAQAWVAYGRR